MRILFLIALLSLALTGCRERNTAPAHAAETAPVSAQIVEVRAQPFTASVEVTGTLVSRSHVEIKAETVGRVVRFDKEEGDAVSAGQPVVWVDEENYRLAIRQAESAAKVAQASLDRTRVQDEYARQELERANNLIHSGGITDKDLKAARLAAQDAAAQVALANAQHEEALAALAVARKRLLDTTIKSPVGGEIEKKLVRTGAYVEAATPVFTVVDNRRLELESQVAAAEIAPLRSGQSVSFRVNSHPGHSFEGQVVEINPAVDTETRTAKVRIAVENGGGRLKAGMFAEGEILTGAERQAIVIPVAAIQRDDRSAKSAFAFVVVQGKAQRRPVRIGLERAGQAEILEGLRPGDLLVTEQTIEIAEGVRVQSRAGGGRVSE